MQRRRNLATYGMNWKERQEYRAKRSAEIANEKVGKADARTRLGDTLIAIEDAFKPEADKLFEKIVASWKKSFEYVMANGKTFNAVRTAYTGFDIDANPLPFFGGRQYVLGTRNQFTPEYIEYNKLVEHQARVKAAFAGSRESVICMRKLYDLPALLAFAEKEAADTVEANKAKLLDGVVRYLYPYQEVVVKETMLVRAYAKGFQGEFTLITDKGPRLFTCKAITAEGPIVSFHWRYIIHVKEL